MPKSDRGIHIRLRCEDLIALYRALGGAGEEARPATTPAVPPKSGE